ncbi:hypothetical protein IC614_00280 [Allosphingosinicella flava]|uniref:Uncharacterized protein n=1 Tax=Allosphingosinicella flava TaxID=2771430 RepID=A0A7T2LMH6_9SPHN|nr:hypothetical protein [Sphingosinicella flava]QPQ55102.1 hypothetical protein IC614_00280 [Sphingosinicella flava]
MQGRLMHLRFQARQCRFLAGCSERQPAAAMFEEMAVRYERQAERIEQRRNPSG